MEIKEYIKKSTQKIYNLKNKKAVELELEDHILLKQSFHEEIGYDEEQAGQLAVEAMGSSEEIAESFAKLHNEGLHEFIDILGTILWAILLGGSSYFLYHYIWGDGGAVPISMAVCMVLFAVFLLAARIAAARQRKSSVVLTLLGGIITAAFAYINYNEMQKSAHDAASLIKLIFKGTLTDGGSTTGIMPIVFAILFLIFVIGVCTVLFILQRKYENFENTRKVNTFNKAFKKTLTALSIFSLLISALLILSFTNVQSNMVKSYNKDYDIVFDISQNCRNKKEFKQFIKDKNYQFEKIDDNIFTYTGQISTITVTFGHVENEEMNPGVYKFSKIVQNILLSHYPQSKETPNDYTINFAVTNISAFKNGINALSLSELMIKDSELDSIYNFTSFEHTTKEKIEFFKKYHPQAISVLPSNNQKKHNTVMTLTFTAGDENNTFDTEFEETLYSENAKTVQKQKEMVKQILNEKPDISNKELAEKLNAKTEDKNEVRKAIEYYIEHYRDFFGNYVDTSSGVYIEYKAKADKLFNAATVFRFSKDLYFCIIRDYYEEHDLIMFDSNTKIDYIELAVFNVKKPLPDYISQYGGNFRKTRYKEKYYFDLNGNAYRNAEDIPYYTKNGDRYRFEITEKNGSDLYMLIGPGGAEYESAFGYIDKDGYLVIDTENEFRKGREPDREITRYHDPDGNEYIKCLEANWDKDGKLIDFEDYLDY